MINMNGKILYIDDDVGSGKMINWAMERLGHTVRIATDGASALRMIDDYIPNIVVCDITMPGLDGYQVCKAMKANPSLANTLFIAQTGWHTKERKKLSKQAGFDHHLVKPVDVNALLQILFLSVKGKTEASLSV
jgi:CheY-like chemotaxis protein